MNRKLLALESDPHANNKWGLLNPETQIEAVTPDGQYYIEEVDLNPEQEFLWSLREQNIEKLVNLADGDEILYFNMGDIGQGNKHPTEKVSQVPYAAEQIAEWNMRPILDLPNVQKARIIYGTEAHDLIGHSETRSLEHTLKLIYPDKDIRAFFHGLADVDGFTLDYSHHGPSTGIRDWTEGNQMRYYTKSLMAEHLNRGMKPPDFVVRGHFHDYHWETVRKWIWEHPTIPKGWLTTHFVIIPSMCGLGSYARKVTRSEHEIVNGMMVMELIDGELLTIHDFVVTRDLRTREIL